MNRELGELWKSTPAPSGVFRGEQCRDLPEPARRYLEHAILPGTPLASAVYLRMHGEIKLRGWLPFTAEQVINVQRGMIWQATVRMKGMPIRGFDRLIDGEGAQRWRLFGLIPIVKASGPDITRSTLGRLAAESVWLPSLFSSPRVSWTSSDSSHAEVRMAAYGESATVALTVDRHGALERLKMSRWGERDGAGFRYDDFGGLVEQESRFDGFTVQTRLRVGWYVGTDRFESEGEFFRVTIDEATYR